MRIALSEKDFFVYCPINQEGITAVENEAVARQLSRAIFIHDLQRVHRFLCAAVLGRKRKAKSRKANSYIGGREMGRTDRQETGMLVTWTKASW